MHVLYCYVMHMKGMSSVLFSEWLCVGFSVWARCPMGPDDLSVEEQELRG